MNYYSRHIGDYIKDTAHLSLLEHGVYSRLMDVYYSRECGIDDADVARLIGARSEEEREALRVVLGDFFKLDGGIWTHKRCDQEIQKYQDKQRKASESASARWKKTDPDADDMRTHSDRSAKAMRTHSEGNAPNNQEPITKKRAKALSAGASPGADVCIALKAAGVQNVNPSHPTLKALVDAGAEPAEFVAAAVKSEGKGDRFAYVLAVVEGDRKRAAQTAGAIHRGPLRVVGKQAALEAHNRAVAEAWAKGEFDAG